MTCYFITCYVEPASLEAGERLFPCREGESRTDQVACSDPSACASRGGHGQDSSEANSQHQRLASIQGG